MTAGSCCISSGPVRRAENTSLYTGGENVNVVDCVEVNHACSDVIETVLSNSDESSPLQT